MKLPLFRSGLHCTICSIAWFALCGLAYPNQDSPLEAELDAIIESEQARAEIPGIAVAMVRDDRTVLAKGYGLANHKTGAKVTPRSLFHMASVTKPFVATAIMQLVEAGTVRIEAPVVDYLPYFRIADEASDSITVGQLLTHTGGMPDVLDYEWDKPQYGEEALEQWIRSLTDRKLIGSPGQQFRYSNIGFEVLGDIIAKASGQSFEEYVQDSILLPLGMEDSTLLIRETDPDLITTGHDAYGKPRKVFPYNRRHAPSSTLYSNVEDLARWIRANLNRGELEGERILERESYDVLWKRTDIEGASVGLSWFLSDHQGHRKIGHSGSDTGFRSTLSLIPDKGIGVVVMVNADARGVVGRVERAVLDLLLKEEEQD